MICLISFGRISHEAEIRVLQHELESRGVQIVPSHAGAPAPHAGPSQAPPALGHGTSNLFGESMANQGGSGPGPAPAPAQQGAPQPPQSSYGGYQPRAAVNGTCSLL